MKLMFDTRSIQWRAAILVFAGVGASLASLSGVCANPASLTDTYYGGTNYYNSNPGGSPPTGDVIGPSSIFDTTSAAVSLSNNVLTVTVNTYFAGAPNNASLVPEVAGTTYGSLFLGPASTWATDHPQPTASWSTDTYHPAEWTYAVVTNGTSGGTAGVYSIGTVSTPGVAYPGTNPAGVIQYYNTSAGGQVTMANVNGNPISYPNGGNPSFYFRQGQAVSYMPGQSETKTAPASWTIVPTTYQTNTENALTEGSITYTIDDWSSLGLGNSVALSWAMTCANDVIQGTVLFDGSNQNANPTPLPAALPLFAAGLGLLGFAGSRKRKERGAL